MHACQSLAPLVETKRKKKTLLRLSLASLSPHHYSLQQGSPFRLFIARQELSNTLKSLQSKKSLQESTERVPFFNSLAHEHNSRVKKRKNVSAFAQYNIPSINLAECKLAIRFFRHGENAGHFHKFHCYTTNVNFKKSLTGS